MGFITGTILVLFVFVSLFLILLVMIQTGKGGMGGVLGGGASQSVFGSSTADVLTKATRVAGLLFLALSLILSFLFAKTSGYNTTPVSDIAPPPAATIEGAPENQGGTDANSAPAAPTNAPAPEGQPKP
ncbi:preprotein translocase subunit SecG [Leptospira wolffii]|uniref:Protein-export membrane protein SecG n=1 Tax=Leptospira wolffii TaxID=409998 RepID=A0A2M9ZDM2_9LEPT|nr:preprotein translocase subunit SecG [Leptospira wolffii]EPG68241.1 preprotein translocase, SecG subunit [Leptospira wolffii serovar Khorat str. Khorat-H2]PJZ66509.1 preprotein translocase subunit SecG [Leptospira wolffii]TGK60174.1 preprotein translocase subunit SecG [Leptospira wolffii]TGK72516.1 preprotein translocase subunit SecG [Leptospira wolffii]TGK76181.1 preprotein translocase subunit SecG [Leptospira wolffii]